jgi:hypothetical protein
MMMILKRGYVKNTRVFFIENNYETLLDSFHVLRSMFVPFVYIGHTGHFLSVMQIGGFGGVGYQSFGGIKV